ncbi:hypothetical protein CPC08DRAFT_818536 [Agrocybe pediades]|nr:hypothetical protein CPC08DRAFT_818536 [Agrocybe pediades]
MPTLPPSGAYLQAIRESSRELHISAGVQITQENIKRLLLSPSFVQSFQRVSKDHGLVIPLNFASDLDELNFISVLSLLNFASGYRVPLHAQNGRGAWDSIRALLFSLYITSTSEGDYLSAKGLSNIHASKIAELMNINIHVERPHESIPGVTIGEIGGPLYELVKQIEGVLNETGDILQNNGYSNLGAFVAEALEQARKSRQTHNDDTLVEFLLERLVSAFPGFRDMAEVNGKPVYCFKKALFLIHAIVVRFGSKSPPPFPIPNTINVPVFSDNVLPSMLVHLGVIDLSSAPDVSKLFPVSEGQVTALLEAAPTPATAARSKTIPKEGPKVTRDQSYILRAAAIDACQLIVETARSLDGSLLGSDGALQWITEVTLPDLDMWIWSVAKDRSDYRALERFVDRNTIYF